MRVLPAFPPSQAHGVWPFKIPGSNTDFEHYFICDRNGRDRVDARGYSTRDAGSARLCLSKRPPSAASRPPVQVIHSDTKGCEA